MKKSDLIKVGITEGLLDNYIKTNKIVVDNDDYQLTDDLLIQIFLNALKNNNEASILIIHFCREGFAKYYINLLYNLYIGNIKEAKVYLDIINEKYEKNNYQNVIKIANLLLNNQEYDNIKLLYEDNEYIGNFVKIIKKYLLLKQYSIVTDLLNELLKIDDNIYYQILNNVLPKLECITSYIVDESNIKDKVTLEGERKLERLMLIDIEKNIPIGKSSSFNALTRINPDNITYIIISKLFIILNQFRTNYRIISNHYLKCVYGDLDQVILILINNHDFYRVRDIINKEIKDSKEFSIKIEIYKILIQAIMYYNKRNNEYIEKERIASISKDNADILIGRYPLSSIKLSTITLDSINMDTDFSKNYYEVYLDCYKNKDYKKAKNSLLQFKVNMASMNIRCNVEHLLKELDILISLELDSESNKEQVNNMLNKAIHEENCGSYENAIFYYQEALKYQSIKNPRIVGQIGLLYNKLGKYQNAVYYLLEADKVLLYPEDYITLIECLIKTYNFKEVKKYVIKYDEYYPEENAYIYYLLSIAYINMQEYSLAEDALNTADAINVACYNVPISYDYEHSVIKSLEKGETVNKYTIDDFVDYNLDKEEKELENSINDLKKSCKSEYLNVIKNESLNKVDVYEQLDYLLKVIKVLNYNEEDEEVSELINFVESIIDLSNLNDSYKNIYEKKLGIYKNSLIDI